MLVEITGKRNEESLTTTSRKVAEVFEKEHKHVLESIRVLLRSAEISANLFIESEYIDGANRKQIEYVMGRDGFSLLVMGFHGDRALQWKLRYIKAFNAMETELKRIYEERKQWEIERAKGIVIRHVLTDTIKMKVADTEHKKFMYPNYTKLIYKVLFGKSMKELQAQYNVKGKESIRDYITTDQLREVEGMEMLVSSLINCGWGYGQIKDFIQQNNVKQLAG